MKIPLIILSLTNMLQMLNVSSADNALHDGHLETKEMRRALKGGGGGRGGKGCKEKCGYGGTNPTCDMCQYGSDVFKACCVNDNMHYCCDD